MLAGCFCVERGEIMGRRLRFKTPEELEETWEMYKDDCDSQMVLTHDFSSKNSEFVSKELKRSITYTIEGFCVFAGIPRSAFYDTYAEKKRYSDIVTRMKEECEVDARKKFELQVIPSQLAGLWMSKYGYTTKQDTNISGSLDTEKTKLDDLIKQMRGDG
nr:MAG TPA: Terminase small subunit [Caudoviricetes sp.]